MLTAIDPKQFRDQNPVDGHPFIAGVFDCHMRTVGVAYDRPGQCDILETGSRQVDILELRIGKPHIAKLSCAEIRVKEFRPAQIGVFSFGFHSERI